MVATSENWMESEIRVSADIGVLPLNTGDLISIEVYFC